MTTTTEKPAIPSPALSRIDLLLAVILALLALVIYTLALAPDILYSDSGEFQALAYTWGITHPTGYPVYLILARVVGFIPVNTLAWRISFFSALAAAVTVGLVYMIVRHFTRMGGAALTCIVLLLSYSFWSQSIIAEVYTPALAVIALILLLLLAWYNRQRRVLLFVTGFLVSAGLGVHLFLLLIAPAVFLFVLFGPAGERGRWHNLLTLFAGGIIGAFLFIGLFVFMDARPTPTSFYATTMIPSRDAWNLAESDLDTPLERFWISVSGVQWRDAMLPTDGDYALATQQFFDDYLAREYTPPTLILAIVGMVAAVIWNRRQLVLLGVSLLIGFLAGTLYHPGDRFIFYLPTYLLVGIFAGIGAGQLIGLLFGFLPFARLRSILTLMMTAVLIFICAAPLVNTRLQAIQTGRSVFVTENYAYPVKNLEEPRLVAECAVSKVEEDDAYLVLGWQALYSIYYVAHVEQHRTGLEIREARPHGTQVMTENLRAEIAAQVAAGRAVYVDENDPTLRRSYTLTPVAGNCREYNLFKVTAQQ